MKTLLQLHHEEQMEAYRSEFAEHWKKIKAEALEDFKTLGFTEAEIAIEEMRHWRRWIGQKTQIHRQ